MAAPELVAPIDPTTRGLKVLLRQGVHPKVVVAPIDPTTRGLKVNGKTVSV